MKLILRAFLLTFCALMLTGGDAYAANPTTPTNISHKSWPGYSRVTLRWATGAADAACLFAIIRDGEMIQDGIESETYFDNAVSPGNHTYVVRNYDKANPANYKDSAPYAVNWVQPRDYSRIKYNIKELYNIRMGAEYAMSSNMAIEDFATHKFTPQAPNANYYIHDTNLPDILVEDNWRGGTFRRVSNTDLNGVPRNYFYLLDKANNCIMRCTDNPLRLVEDGSQSNCWQKIVQLPKGKNAWGVEGDAAQVSLGVDDAGNILVKSGNYYYHYISHITIIPFDAYGDQSKWWTIEVPNYEAYLNHPYNQNGQSGRVDYFRIHGNMCGNGYLAGAAQTNAQGQKIGREAMSYAHVLFSPHRSESVCQMTINPYNLSGANVAKDAAGNVKASVTFNWYQHPESIVKRGTDATENYAFFVHGCPNGIVHQLRGTGYYYVNDIGTSSASSFNVLSGMGMASQAGGTTVYFDGIAAENGIRCNDMFLITGLGEESQAGGEFQMFRALPSVDYDVNQHYLPSQFNFSPNTLMGEDNINQDAAGEGVLKNSNSDFLYADTIHVDVKSPTDFKVRAYIWQYVTGFRIAKYEIIPRVSVPSPTVKITADKSFGQHDKYGNTIIDGVNVKVSWNKPEYDNDDNGDYGLTNYSVKVTGPQGEKWTIKAPARFDSNGRCHWQLFDANGRLIDEGDIFGSAGQYVQNFEVPIRDAKNKGKYNAEIITEVSPKIDYLPVNSDPAWAEDIVDLVVENPEVTAYVWKGQGDNPTRVDLAFDHFNTDPENPVTHYEVWIDKHDGRGPQPDFVTCYNQFVNNPNNTTGECDKRFISTKVCVPGQFFVIKDKPFEENWRAHFSTIEEWKAFMCDPSTTAEKLNDMMQKPDNKLPGDWKGSTSYPTLGAEDDYVKGGVDTPNGLPSVSFYPELKPGEDPTNWDYYIKPVYADETPFRTVTEGKAVVKEGTTSAESVKADIEKPLEVAPNPAETETVISATEAIESISVFASNGAQVIAKTLDATRTSVTLNISSLSAGVYYVKVNNLPVVRLIKR